MLAFDGPAAHRSYDDAGPLADVETSSADYARRFDGPVGAFFLETQTRVTLELLRPWPAARVLDVGGGHAQTVGPLTLAGHEVTVLGSAPVCAARVQPWLADGTAKFVTGNPLALPYPDRAFDIVLSYRLLSHVAPWKRLLHELARVANRAVLVDYPTLRSSNVLSAAVATIAGCLLALWLRYTGPDPTLRSSNVLSAALFGLKRGIEKNTRPYLLFRDAQVASALAQAGTRVTARRGQFVFPMALHRALRQAAFTRGLEATAAALGLRRLLGSPVILRAERG